MQKYEIIKQRFDKLFDEINGSRNFRGVVHPEESKLRLSLPIKPGQGQYIFNIKSPDVDGIKNISLDRNDVFIPNNWGVQIELVNTTTGVSKTYTYAPMKKTGKPSFYEAGFKNDDIEALYTGYLQWLLDNQVMLATYPMEKFHKVPETQGGFLLNSDNEPVDLGIKVERSLDKDLELIIPRYNIAGTRDHKITVNFNAAGLTFPVTEGYTANLVLLMEGFLVKGGCQTINGETLFGDAAGNW